MKDLQVIRYSSDKKKEWNAFVTNSKNGTFLFDRNFMEYHSDRFVDYSLMVYEDKKVVALLPANKDGDRVCSHQGLSYGGLVLGEKIKYKTTLFVFKAILEFLDQQEIKKLEIKEIPNIYATCPSDEMLHLMFLCKAELIRRDGLSVIDLRNEIQVSRDRKAGIKRGFSNNLEVKEVGCFNTFWQKILIPNLDKKHRVKPVHTLEEITLLKQRFPKNIRQFNVYKNDVIVAGTTIFETEKVAHSQYISGNLLKNELGSLDFLHSHMLKNVFQQKNYFDFGISNEKGGTKVNEGLQYWKESFGARMITQDFYSVSTKNHELLNSVFI